MVERRQQVAVFGSWRTPRAQLVNERSQAAGRHWTHRLSNDALEEACRAVGYRLAGHNIDLLTASDSTRTADYHVVEGFLERRNCRRLAYRQTKQIQAES